MNNPFLAVSAVVVCSSVLAWLACRAHQPVILAYFLCGVLLGPVGAGLVRDVELLDIMSRFGVALLLFLAGLVLHPDRLLKFFRAAVVLTVAGGALIWVLVFAFLRAWGFGTGDATVAAFALMFSSTILVVKLLPTTTLHQRRMGSICIAVLIAQDLLAVIVLTFVGSRPPTGVPAFIALLAAKVVLLIAVALVLESQIVRRMMRSSDRYGEVLLILCLGWCVGMAMLAEVLGVPYEVGAFVAGVAMARGKIARVLSEQLKPLRDFFLMFFFFVLGTGFELTQIGSVWLPALLLALLIVVVRRFSLERLLLWLGEEKGFAGETALRLGQASEFALIIAVAAAHGGNLSARAEQLVQLATVLTMLISSYAVILRCPTPIGVRERLQRD